MEILETIGRYSCVKAVFSGHHHAGGFAYYKNIPVVTVEGVVETENENAFGIVKIYDNKLVLEGKGRMTSRELKAEKRFLCALSIREAALNEENLLSLKNLTGFLKKSATPYSPTRCAVPLAWPGLTTLFGKGRGGTPAP